MQTKGIRFFIHSAGVLIFITAAAKLISSFGSAHILHNLDPILNISFRTVFWIVGILEIIIALICLLGKKTEPQVGLLAWLATSFLVYRLGLFWIGYDKPCSCLGNLTDALHISPRMTDTGMKVVLAYLLIGSYAALFWLWKEKREAHSAIPTSTDATGSQS
jgi:hypothetical protein